MSHEFDPFEMSDADVETHISQLDASYEDDANRMFEERAYHGAIALTGACVLLRFTGIESAEYVGNWCGGLATIALASGAVVSPEHRSLTVRIRGLIDEFKNPAAHGSDVTPRVTLKQLEQQESAELDNRSTSWFWSKWNNLEY